VISSHDSLAIKCVNRIAAHSIYSKGHTVDGTQAEYARIPLADSSLFHAPKDVDLKALVMLSDIGRLSRSFLPSTLNFTSAFVETSLKLHCSSHGIPQSRPATKSASSRARSRREKASPS
jgi:hypothetical protein